MEVGLQFIFQNTHGDLTDAQMFRQETELAIRAEELGMDYILAPEHHFDPNYSMMPDTMQWLAYVAARTSTMKIGPGAIILPWWTNPTRVAEKIAMLDILSDGRLEKYRKRVELAGEMRCSMAVSYAGLPFDKANASLELIAREVAPALRMMEIPAGTPA